MIYHICILNCFYQNRCCKCHLMEIRLVIYRTLTEYSFLIEGRLFVNPSLSAQLNSIKVHLLKPNYIIARLNSTRTRVYMFEFESSSVLQRLTRKLEVVFGIGTCLRLTNVLVVICCCLLLFVNT